MPGERVVAVVVTYNRRQMLVDCLEALAEQTHPVAEVVLVDSASTAGTEEHVEAGGIASRLPITYVRLRRNGGGAEGFHYGVRDALELDSEWLWLMDDDCLPATDALERLLADPKAADAAVLAPVVTDAGGTVLPIHRGRIRPRLFFAPLVALRADEHEGAAVEIEFSSFVGPLLRTRAVRGIGLPLREAFIRFEDVEFLSRFGPGERMWLVPDSRIAHREADPVRGSDFRAMWGDYSQRIPFSAQWKRLYGFRNQIFCGVRGGYIGRAQALSYLLVQAVRTVLFHERRARTLWLLALYGYDGWRGRFRNVPPGRWIELGSTLRPARYINRTALRYGSDTSTPGRRLGAAAVTR
jgi:rhamnopyranosyl-N-acetylglucosaminyl-diphospho-decaprenol beta-1,3/1,4-galactofuranosyltransferase